VYGPSAIEFVKYNFGRIGIVLAILIVATVVFYFFARRRLINCIEA
jgi:hypothetical protein